MRLDDYQEINSVSLLGRPSGIDQVIQCDLLHVTAYVAARVPILLLYTPTLNKRSVISFLPSDMMHVILRLAK